MSSAPDAEPLAGSVGPRSRTVANIAGLSGMAEIAGRVLAFGFFVLVARTVTPTVFGEVRYVVTVGLLGAAIGVPFLMEISRRARPGAFLGTAANQIDITGWAWATLLGAGVAAGLGAARPDIAALATVCVIAQSCNNMMGVVARSHRWMRTLVGAVTSGNLLQLILLGVAVVLVPGRVGTTVIVIIYCVGFMVPVIGFGHFRGVLARRAPSVSTVKAHVDQHRGRLGALLLQQAAHLAITGADLVVLGVVASPEQLGYYGVARSLASLVSSVVNALFHLILPSAVQRGATTHDGATLFRLGVISVCVIVTAVVLLAPGVVPWLYGADYAAAVQPVRTVAIGVGLYGLALMRGAAWIAEGRAGAFSLIVAVFAAMDLATVMVFPAAQTALGAGAAFLAAASALVIAMGFAEFRFFRRNVAR